MGIGPNLPCWGKLVRFNGPIYQHGKTLFDSEVYFVDSKRGASDNESDDDGGEKKKRERFKSERPRGDRQGTVCAS